MFINDIHALGLQAAQGLLVTSGYHWGQGEASRHFAERFRAQIGCPVADGGCALVKE